MDALLMEVLVLLDLVVDPMEAGGLLHHSVVVVFRDDVGHLPGWLKLPFPLDQDLCSLGCLCVGGGLLVCQS